MVLVALAYNADGEGNVEMSVSAIHRDSGASKSTVKRVLSDLRAMSLLTDEGMGPKGRRFRLMIGGRGSPPGGVTVNRGQGEPGVRVNPPRPIVEPQIAVRRLAEPEKVSPQTPLPKGLFEETTSTEGKESKHLESDLVQEVFQFWKQTMGKNGRTVLDAKRRRNIKARLREFSVDDIKQAIVGCSQDSFSMGQNDRNRPFNDIELICRDAKHVEDFRAMAKAKADAQSGSLVDQLNAGAKARSNA